MPFTQWPYRLAFIKEVTRERMLELLRDLEQLALYYTVVYSHFTVIGHLRASNSTFNSIKLIVTHTMCNRKSNSTKVEKC